MFIKKNGLHHRMGIELKAVVMPENVKLFYVGEGKAAFLASLKDNSGFGYSPNLFAIPLTLIRGGFTHPAMAELVRASIGSEAYAGLTNLAERAESTWRKLFETAAGHGLDEKGTLQASIDELVGGHDGHISQLRSFAAYHAIMDDVDTSVMNDQQTKLFNLGLRGLALVVIYANALYDPESREEFLRHVRQGVVERPYMQLLLEKALPNAGSAKTL